jgi:hypothetical protein
LFFFVQRSLAVCACPALQCVRGTTRLTWVRPMLADSMHLTPRSVAQMRRAWCLKNTDSLFFLRVEECCLPQERRVNHRANATRSLEAVERSATFARRRDHTHILTVCLGISLLSLLQSSRAQPLSLRMHRSLACD